MPYELGQLERDPEDGEEDASAGSYGKPSALKIPHGTIAKQQDLNDCVHENRTQPVGDLMGDSGALRLDRSGSEPCTQPGLPSHHQQQDTHDDARRSPVVDQSGVLHLKDPRRCQAHPKKTCHKAHTRHSAQAMDHRGKGAQPCRWSWDGPKQTIATPVLQGQCRDDNEQRDPIVLIGLYGCPDPSDPQGVEREQIDHKTDLSCGTQRAWYGTCGNERDSAVKNCVVGGLYLRPTFLEIQAPVFEGPHEERARQQSHPSHKCGTAPFTIAAVVDDHPDAKPGAEQRAKRKCAPEQYRDDEAS